MGIVPHKNGEEEDASKAKFQASPDMDETILGLSGLMSLLKDRYKGIWHKLHCYKYILHPILSIIIIINT